MAITGANRPSDCHAADSNATCRGNGSGQETAASAFKLRSSTAPAEVLFCPWRRMMDSYAPIPQSAPEAIDDYRHGFRKGYDAFFIATERLRNADLGTVVCG